MLRCLLVLISINCLIPIVHAVTTQEQFEFQNGGDANYKTWFDGRTLSFLDKTGEQTLRVQKCNQMMVQKFWRTLRSHAEHIQVLANSKPKSKLQAGTLKIDGIEYSLLITDRNLRFFRDVRGNLISLFIESLRSCQSE